MSARAGSRDHRDSLRWRLSLTYAGVALLTALVLGGVLLAMLQVHFSGREMQHLRRAADQVARELWAASRSGQAPEEVARITAFGTQARVRLYDSGHGLLADSGSPWTIKPASVGRGAGGAAGGVTGAGTTGGGGAEPQATPSVGQGGSRGGDGRTAPASPRSDKTYERAARAGSPGGVAYIRLSEVPAEGSDVMSWIVLAWVTAAAAAVGAAATAGYLLSRRIARPVVALAEASERMASGDLGTRADVRGHGEIGRLARSFNQMASQVEDTVTALQRFVSDAAHELGTPLTALRADLELAQDSAVTDDERRLVARALSQEERLEDLAGGLLQLSRLQSAGWAGRRQPVDVAPLAASVADAFASRAEQADVGLDLDVAHPAPVALADPERLRTALLNLLDNAVKFTPAGGHVELGVRREGGQALIWVADDGPGIRAEDRARVFERFYRARRTADAPGSGLGLAIVRATLEASGGSARLAETASGTRIELRLPLAPA